MNNKSDEIIKRHIIAYMIKENLKDLDLRSSCRAKNLCWQSIARSIYGISEKKIFYNQVLYINKIWQRNTRNFRSCVLQEISKINLVDENCSNK